MPERPVHTFSIVARDPETGEIGVAVQSHWFSVGPIVPWAEAGVGAVATQSFVDPAYGPKGLELLKTKSAKEALDELIAKDAGQAVRQVAMIDAKGRVAAHTGASCIECAGHKTGANYSVQANMMLNDQVVPAMARAFETTKGDLTDRLLAALEAAQKAGGDIRGQQSAAILVVRGTPTGRSWEDRVVDLRVEDHAEPVKELRRLVEIHRGYRHMNAGDLAIEKGDLEGAMREYEAAAKCVPDNPEIQYWNAVTLATNGHLDRALPIFKKVFAKDANWKELLKRLPKAGILSEELVKRILAGV